MQFHEVDIMIDYERYTCSEYGEVCEKITKF